MSLRKRKFEDCKMALPLKSSTISVALFVTGNILLYGIIQLEVSSFMYSLAREIFLARFDRSHTVGTQYLQYGFLQLNSLVFKIF